MNKQMREKQHNLSVQIHRLLPGEDSSDEYKLLLAAVLNTVPYNVKLTKLFLKTLTEYSEDNIKELNSRRINERINKRMAKFERDAQLVQNLVLIGGVLMVLGSLGILFGCM